jgi:excisionase family DNA binding protein
MTAADLATAADVERVMTALADLDAKLDLVLASLPSQWISLREAAKRMGCDPRTISAMLSRGELVGRRAGRRILIDATSIRPPSRESVAALAREARG